jgi:hypothetical protein
MGLGSGIRDPRSGIRKQPIPDTRSRGQKGTLDPGSRIRIRNTACRKIRDVRIRTNSIYLHTYTYEKGFYSKFRVFKQ